ERGGADSVDAQQEAIRAFGAASEIARAFVPSALQSLARRTAVLTALAVIGVFIVLYARVGWYLWVAWPAGGEARAAGQIGLPIDRVAFALAFLAALAALASMIARPAPARFNAGFGRRIARCIRLAAVAMLALFAAVATELVLTGIRFAESDLDPSAL